MTAAHHPTFWLIAGPDGVGKTTFAMKRLEAISGSINFVNFDEISRGLSPLRSQAAEREAATIALSRVAHFIASGSTFALETTLSGKAQMRLLREARRAGLATSLLYFSVRTPEICLERIARRVAEGGHDVPADIVRRRFVRSSANLPGYLALSDLWRIYEASGPAPALALEGHRTSVTYRDEDQLRAANPVVAAIAKAIGR
jgi:predicted ABC-type ATPase